MRPHELATWIAILGIVSASNLPRQAKAQFECRLAPGAGSYSFSADTVQWQMGIRAGQSCVRGFRQYDATIRDVKTITPPQSGELSFEGTAFYYKAASDFRGTDSFAFSVSGERRGISGMSTIRVVVSVMK